MPKLPHNRTWYIKKLIDKAKKCVKIRDKYTCQYTGKEVSGSDCHASHVLNVGTHKNMELDPTNMKVLSSYYHLHWWHKDVLHATEWYKNKFPERYDYLMKMSKLKFKIPTSALAELHENTKADGMDYGYKYYELIQDVIKEFKDA
jgi:hypothetical protein|tara:strand:+ start:5901 stop:6338 length:438 start_codon:yes stop_codon:yes gene_type:complete